jgi:hypothetical protein
MLGEAGVLDLRASREVAGDTERFIRARDEQLLPVMAEVFARANIATTEPPNKDTIDFCETLTGYRPDARILASAIECAADVLTTYDSKHLLGNLRIRPPDVAVMVLNPKDTLEWCYRQWTDSLKRE